MREGARILEGYAQEHYYAAFTPERIAAWKDIGHALDPETPLEALFPALRFNKRRLPLSVSEFMQSSTPAAQAVHEWHSVTDTLPREIRSQLTTALKWTLEHLSQHFQGPITVKHIREADRDELVNLQYFIGDQRAAALKEIFGYFDEFPPTI